MAAEQDEGFVSEDRLYHIEVDCSVSSGPVRGNMVDGLPRMQVEPSGFIFLDLTF